MLKRFWKSKINRRLVKSAGKLAVFAFLLLFISNLGKIQGTNSFFMDTATSAGNEMTAGYWIPELTMTVSPDSPDGMNGWYVNKPCIKLFSDIDDVTIHYSFFGDNPASGTVVEDTCVYPPEGVNDFSAYAENNANSSWVSSTISRDFKVDTVAPSAPDWIRPADGSFTRQNKNVLLDWTDSTDASSGVAGYEYQNAKAGGDTWKSVDYCGLIDESQFPNDQVGPSGSCIVADAGTFSADGRYDRKVRAADVAGNISAWSSEWRLTRDTVEPTSHADAFSPATTSDLTFDVVYSASDDRAGVKNVELFYRKDGGSWTSHGKFTSSPISFTATGVGVYDFYTIAEDKADDLTNADMADGSNGDDGKGNIETKTAVVEATMTVTAPVADPGDVVINEVMWMGSSASTADEWVELRNMTSHSIDIGQWKLKNVRHSSGNDEIMIPAGKTIPANGYFLIANYPKTSSNTALNVDADEVNNSLEILNSGNGNIILKDNNGAAIDEAKGDSWPAGENTTLNKSMERNDTPGDGTFASDWHTCVDEHCNDTAYWDSEGNDYGTPGHANLSENDPTSNSDLIEVQPLAKGLKIDRKTESENISKNIPIKIIGALDVAENLKYKIKQKIKKVDMQGDFPDKEIEIDLSKLGLVEKTGEIKVRINDLDLPEGVKVVSPKKNELVLLITVKDKKGKKSKRKEKAELKPKEQAVLPGNGETDKDGEKNDGDSGNGEPGDLNS